MYDLKTLGWNSFFENEFEPYKEEGCKVGRVALEHKGAYRIYTDSGELVAEVTGRVRFHARERGDFPAVGDWVVLGLHPDKRASIHAILPRKSKFSRKAATSRKTIGSVAEEQIVATNIDTVFLIQGLDNDFNLRRIERYLVLAQESGATPVIILNKADLCHDVEAKLREVESIALGVPVHAISSKKDFGLEHLYQYLGEGLTIAFLGSSGVGKSTLINRLVGKDVQKVAEVRAGDDRGRHTTRHRELIMLPSGGLLIDTPGMRELQLWDVGEGVSDTFADIKAIASRCYFSDCRHENEPDCAVRDALAEGSLDANRFENFTKMTKEASYFDAQHDQKAKMSRKDREKKLHKMMKTMKKRGY